LFWAFVAALVGFALYGYGHFRTFHNFEFYKGIEVGASVLGIIVGLRLILIVIPLEDSEKDLGKLKGQKLSIIVGLYFVPFAVSALTTLDIVYFENKTVLPTSPTPARPP
jgi:hypothetical protein